VIVTEPDVGGAVYVNEHVLEDELAADSVHCELLLKLPPMPPSFQETVPVGVVGDPAVSVIVAVDVTELPTVRDEGMAVTVVVVESKGAPEEANKSLMTEAVASFCPRLPKPKMLSTVASSE